MFNETKKFESGSSWIIWGLSAVVILVTLQATSVEASKPKTLDVVPVGGSDEISGGNYVPPPRSPPRSPPRQSPPRPRIPSLSSGYRPPMPPPIHAPRQSDEYYRARNEIQYK